MTDEALELDQQQDQGSGDEGVEESQTLEDQADESSGDADESPNVDKAGEDEGEGAKSSDDEDEQKRKRKRTFGARIKRLTEEKRRLAERAEEAERELQRLKAQANGGDDPEHPRPKREDFEDYDDYEQARDRWLIEQVRRQEAAKAEESGRVSPVDQARQETVSLIAEIGGEKYGDFADVVGKDTLPITTDMLDVIGEVENDAGMTDLDLSADVLYYIGNNPTIAAQLSKLTGTALARRIGRIAAKIEAGVIKPGSKPAGSASSAPPPIKPVGGRDSKVRSIYSKNISMEEYVKMRRAGKTT